MNDIFRDITENTDKIDESNKTNLADTAGDENGGYTKQMVTKKLSVIYFDFISKTVKMLFSCFNCI